MWILILGYIILPAVTLAALLGLMYYTWHQKHIRGAEAYNLLLALYVVIILCALLLSVTTNETLAHIWSRLRLLAISLIPIFQIYFALVYTGRKKWFTTSLLVVLLIVPLITQVMLWTNSQHELFRSGWHIIRAGGVTFEVANPESGYQLHSAYIFLAGVVGLFIFLSALPTRNKLFRWQIIGIIIGAVVHVVSGFLISFAFQPIPFFPNLLYLSIAPAVIFYSWAMFRYELLRLSPITYTDILDNLQDGLIALNHEGYVIQINEQARQIFGLTGDTSGRPVTDILSPWLLPEQHNYVELIHTARLKGEKIKLELKIREQIFQLQALPILEHLMAIGQILICCDITEQQAVQQTLQHNEEMLRSIITSLEDMIFALDAEGHFVAYYQKEVASTFGRLPEAFIGQHFEAVLLPSITVKLTEAIERLRSSGVMEQFEYQLNTKGVPQWFNGRVSMRYGENHQTAGFTVVIRNITDITNSLQELEESGNRIRAFLEQSPIAIGVINTKGSVSLLNHSFTDLFGYTVDDIPTAAEWFALAYPDPADRELARRQWNQDVAKMLNTGQPRIPREYKLRTKDGDFKNIVIAAAQVGDQFVVTFSDVTQQRFTEAALQQAKEAAEAANEAKSRFLANMSHELRTPLNAILGFTELMTTSALNLADQQRLEIINSSGQHLLALINDVLSISKIEAGKEKLYTIDFDLAETLHQLFNSFQGRAQEKKLSYQLHIADDIPRYVHGDSVKLRQIVLNLLSNAIKFTHKGTVTFTVGWEQQPRPELHLIVQDTGIGISAAEQQLLFKPFVQTNSGRLAQQGTGLGLTLVHQYVQLMQGQLEFESQEAVGTTFHITLPLEKVKQPETQTSPQTFANITRAFLKDGSIPKILIVDDLEANVKLLEAFLELIKVEVKSAYNGQQAIQIMPTFDPHLIFLDLRMPIMDGYEMIAWLRDHHYDTPVIALTASAYESHEVLLQQGFTDYLRKPLSFDTLLTKLPSYLPLEYEYQAKPVKNEAPEFVLPATLDVPIAWLVEYQQAIAELNPQKLGDLALQLIPTHPRVASTLIALAQSYDLDKIADWLDLLTGNSQRIPHES